MEIVGNDGNALGTVGNDDAGVKDGSQELDVEPFFEFNSCHDGIVVFGLYYI